MCRPSLGERRRAVGGHDVVVIGFGPSGLALAVALEEAAAGIDALFLERKIRFSWHEGMLFDDARMQVSCLKDLATLRDPGSRFTFLQYLKDVGRLDQFVNLGTLRPTRLEFNEYLKWAAGGVQTPVRYATEVLAVEPVTIGGDEVGGLRIRTRALATGAVGEHLARNVVVAAGGEPRFPDAVDGARSPRIFHSSEFLQHLERHFPDRHAAVRFVVVGDGQSGAEIFEHLASTYPAARVIGVTRSIGYRPMDETPFVNEAFFPEWVDTFHRLGREKREALLATLRNTNYAAVDASLIERIYRRIYEDQVAGRGRVEVRLFLELRGAVDSDRGVKLEFDDWINECRVDIDADAAVLATGYSVPNPHPMLAALASYLKTDETGRYLVGRDYRIAAREGFYPGVYLQGYAEGTHGISDTLLSIACTRAAEVTRHLRASLGAGNGGRERSTKPISGTNRGGDTVYLHRFDPAAGQGENGKRGFRIVPGDDLPTLPFGAMWSVLGPGASSSRDMHHESEIFFIAEGSGKAHVGAESRTIRAGDAVYVPAFGEHTFENTSTSGDLRYVSVWWENGGHLRQSDQWARVVDAPVSGQILLTATPPTVNGELHLGHISGPYLAADICRRYLGMRGREAIYLSGSDENQSYVVTKARQKGWTPRDTADRFADRVEAAFAALAIEPTVFARPASSRYHTRFCQEFFARLLANGKIERRTTPTLHCESCKRYLFEAHVSGTCPHCGHGSDGSACEDCARPNDCIDLLDPRCNQCGATPTVVETERFFFPLSRYEGLLRAYLSSVAMSPHMRALCETMLTDGLPDIAVSHLADWGIEVPVEGFSNQVIYVWFEMCPGYLAASQQAADRSDAFSSWEDIWKAPDTEIVQFFGFDNGYFHALLFPALLMAYDPQIRLPSVFVTNEFYLLDGQKFSSSREHAIWATDFAARQPADWVRFYLSLDRPECRRTNFTEVGYHSTISRELEGAWLPWLRGVGQRAIDEFDGLAPATATYTAAQKRFFGKLLGLIAAMEEALDLTSFSPPQSVGVLCDLVHTSAAFGATEAYLKGVDALRHERRTAVALELAAVRTLATLAAPVLPSLAGQLWQALGFLDDGPQRWATAPTFIPVGQDVSCLSCLSPW